MAVTGSEDQRMRLRFLCHILLLLYKLDERLRALPSKFFMVYQKAKIREMQRGR
jgi:hypothetical protein